MDLTVIRSLLLDTCQLIHIFVRKGEKKIIMLKIRGRPPKLFSRVTRGPVFDI